MPGVLTGARWLARGIVAGVSSAIALGLIVMIRAYQVAVAPLLIGNCKFYPSCSHYFIQAVELHGCGRGTILGIKRVFRCNPFSMGGYDPVPPIESTSQRKAEEITS
jgi:uncharacterized protein